MQIKCRDGYIFLFPFSFKRKDRKRSQFCFCFLFVCRIQLTSGLGSISPTIYVQLFCTYVFCEALMYLQFGFVIYWRKEIGAKTAWKMWVKLTTGVSLLYLRIPLRHYNLAERPIKTKNSGILELKLACGHYRSKYVENFFYWLN